MKRVLIVYRFTVVWLSLLLIVMAISSTQAQLPKWDLDPDCGSITTEGVAAFTCGASFSNAMSENFTLGMVQIVDVIPLGRFDVTDEVQIFHHPSWHVDVIGNVFGVTMDSCGNTYVAASSNYSGGSAILKYGALGGPDDESLQSAGAIYRIDAATGQAEHFVSLPQLETQLHHPNIPKPRDTGPGLGNITYHPVLNQFYATNFEDGRIYRIDVNGNILDSYDPGLYDTGNPGLPELREITYGIVLSPDGTKLFFGTSEDFDEKLSARVVSVELDSNGGFTGNVDNSSLPVNADWDNFVGDETTVFVLPECEFDPMLLFSPLERMISDIEFLPNGQMFLGLRNILNGNIHSSSNHSAQALVIEETSGAYSIVGEVRPGGGNSAGFPLLKECYGGVSFYENSRDEVDYVVSSADMLTNFGPHGLHVSDENNFTDIVGLAPITPAAVISYGGVSTGGDPKGIGGDVYVFRGCGCKTCQCVGDINRDGVIDLLDVAPFVAAITEGTDPCADINGDGVIDLLDVQPFVELLQSGVGCGRDTPKPNNAKSVLEK